MAVDPPPRSASAEEVALEAERYRRLQRAVDVALALIYQSGSITPGEAIDLVLGARRIALSLFPGSEETFDLLYRPRLMRAISERLGLEPSLEDGSTERGGA